MRFTVYLESEDPDRALYRALYRGLYRGLCQESHQVWCRRGFQPKSTQITTQNKTTMLRGILEYSFFCVL